MGGLTTHLNAIHAAKRGIAACIRWSWNLHQYLRSSTRSFGAWEWGVVVVTLLALSALAGTAHWRSEIQTLESTQQSLMVPSHSLHPIFSSTEEAKHRMQDFEHLLIPHENIPQALGDLLQLAELEGLLVRRADYRPEEDGVGPFMRFHIQMPIKGTTDSIQRFLRSALLAQHNLILESVQLRREASESHELEANVHWVLLTHLPLTTRLQMEVKP